MRLAFMGTPDFSVPALTALLEAGHEIAAVYSQPPRPAGRGKKLQKSAVHKAAEAAGLEVRTPKSLRNADVQNAFSELRLDAAVVVAYGLILPAEILTTPKLGCLNIHASLLPRWRGAAPIHRAIMAGDHETGVCIMQMDEGLDTGDVLLERKVAIPASATTLSLHDTLSDMGGEMIVQALEGLEAGTLTAMPQTEDGTSYARKIEKSEAKIVWTQSAAEIDRQIRGLFPFPGAWAEIGGERVKILSASVEDAGGPAGAVLDDALLIACGAGALRLKKLQRAGKSAATAEDFLRGFPVPTGTRLA